MKVIGLNQDAYRKAFPLSEVIWKKHQTISHKHSAGSIKKANSRSGLEVVKLEVGGVGRKVRYVTLRWQGHYNTFAKSTGSKLPC